MVPIRVLFVLAVTGSMILSLVIISIELYELYVDQQSQKSDHLVVTHLLISLGMQTFANILIFFDVFYITQHVLRGGRYSWRLSCHYFTYILLEILSVVCVIGKWEYLQYPLLLHTLQGILFVMLFFYNCFASMLLNTLEYTIREEREKQESMRISSKTERPRSPCVHISLTGSNVNIGAGPSGVSPSVTFLD